MNVGKSFLIWTIEGLCVDVARQVHGHVCKNGLNSRNVIENSLLDIYVKCDEMDEAHKLFDEMSERDVFSWNSLIQYSK
jgi:pentatricopeptide repeat protein